MRSFYNLLILFSALNIPCAAPQNKDGCKEKYIVFVQSDLSDRFESDAKNFNSIWGTHIPTLFKRVAKKEDVCIEIYPLCHETANANSMLIFNSASLKDKMEYDKGKKRKEAEEQARRMHASILANHNNQQQDIIGSIALLMAKKDASLEIDRTKIIYISDMIHYNTAIDQTDSEKGLFNFESFYSLGIFERTIQQGFLYGRTGNKIKIKRLVDDNKKQILEIYSVYLPPGKRPIPAEVLVKTPEVWRDLFKALGASTIRLNLSLLDGVLPEN